MRTFRDRAVLLTGASSGIGRSMAHALGEAGARVALAARDAAVLQVVADEVVERGGEALTLPSDVSIEEQAREMVKRAHEHFGSLDALINNAGRGLTALVEELPLDEARDLFAVNSWGPLVAIQAAIPFLARSGEGLVVNVGSVLGQRSLPTMVAYCMSKAALGALSESLRTEVRHRGIHVLHAEPGLTRTAFGERRRIVGEHRRHFDDSRAMEPDEVAKRILRAALRRKDRVSMTASGRSMIWMNRLAPGLLNRILERAYRKGAFS